MSSDTVDIPRAEIEEIVSALIDQKLSKLKYMTLEDGKALVLDRLDKLTAILVEKGMLSMQEINSGRPAPPPAKERPLRGLSPMQKKFKCDDRACGAVHDNPNFKDSDYYCSDCHEPLGSDHDVHRLEKCPTCGGNEVVKNPRARD